MTSDNEEPYRRHGAGTLGFRFGFSINTDEGKSYMVEATGDLLQWNKIETINGTGSSVQFTDTRNEVFQYQYYRVRMAE